VCYLDVAVAQFEDCRCGGTKWHRRHVATMRLWPSVKRSEFRKRYTPACIGAGMLLISVFRSSMPQPNLCSNYFLSPILEC
jgi:hypothetical protein